MMMASRSNLSKDADGHWCRSIVSTIALVTILCARTTRAADLVPSTPSMPVSPAEAASRLKLPPGFRATLFASEPEIVQPIAFTIDPRGRLWVVECYSYPLWQGGPNGKDRILIFEDTDGDGKHDRRTVFYEGGTNFTGIELGFGGAWVCSTPNLIFIPDRDGDDKPDGPPEIRLDGWSKDPRHNMFNALKWGPDGWLWGCNGILSESKVGTPGMADKDRVPINCGVWRYHPTRKVFEAVAHGTTNPWGLDFDDLGEAFITNCVIPHLFHVVIGAHFQRMFGPDMNPYSYGLMETCADHLHWAGGRWQDSREGSGNGGHGVAGGGHAHVGAMIYLGDNWPAKYRNSAFMCNIHGHRVNHDSLERQKSGYVARHQRDFLQSSDTWFRGMELKYGPDGGVYLTDWSDIGECHENDADGSHRENGRILKITYEKPKKPAAPIDLAKLSNVQLADQMLHQNDWYVRTARLILQERMAAGDVPFDAHPLLRQILRSNPDVTRRLRALWALNVSGGIDRAGLIGLLDEKDETIRSWAIRLLVDAKPVADSEDLIRKLSFLAAVDRSPKVHLALASALQRLPDSSRREIGMDLIKNGEDASDRALSLMIWYGVEPLARRNQGLALSMAVQAKIPIVRQYLARRIVSADPSKALSFLSGALRQANDDVCRDLLAGSLEGVRGMKRVAVPRDWGETSRALAKSADVVVRERAALLGLELGEPRAIDALQTLAKDSNKPLVNRRRALASLAERRIPGLVPDLLAMLDERDTDLRGQAIRALAGYADAAIPEAILSRYARFSASEREDAVGTLIARKEWASALLDAVGKRTISRLDLTPAVARQIQSFNDAKLSGTLDALHADVSSTAKNKVPLIAKYKGLLASSDHPPADAGRGRGVFSRLCQQCHRMFDTGGDVGPDLTGSDRANADYILENVLDPSATVGRDYTVSTIATTDGRLIGGIVREQTSASVTVQTTTERIVIPREDIEQFKPSTVSMMPEGQLERLTPQEIRDLFAYLGSKQQVMPGK